MGASEWTLASRCVCVCVVHCEKEVVSSCQPVEIPGNVIQYCSLKNHSARNSPGQQRQIDAKQNMQDHRPPHGQVTFILSLNISATALSRMFNMLQRCSSDPEHTWLLSTNRLPVASNKNNFSMTEWRIRLVGNGQLSGTPFRDICSFLFCSLLSVRFCG